MFRFLKSLGKTRAWNDDPLQKELAEVLRLGALYEISGGKNGKRVEFVDVNAIAVAGKWSSDETADRCVHAASMLRPILDAKSLRMAVTEARLLYNSYKQL
jgi:hypothetical protein